MDNLIKQLEEATEGSRELDAAIFFEALTDYDGRTISLPAYAHFVRGYGSDSDLPYYTTSIDAALTLVPEGWEICGDILCPDHDYNFDAWNGKFAPDGRDIKGWGRTSALALCIAALKARECNS